MDVRIEEIEEIGVARIRHVGDQSGLGECFERLMGWVVTIGAAPVRTITLEHDNPEVTPVERRRWDACAELQTDADPPAGIVLDRIPSGRYAVYTLRGPYEQMPEAYGYLFGTWLPNSGEAMDDRPSMEIYRNSPLDTAPEDLVTDLCVPLRPTSER